MCVQVSACGIAGISLLLKEITSQRISFILNARNNYMVTSNGLVSLDPVVFATDLLRLAFI